MSKTIFLLSGAPGSDGLDLANRANANDRARTHSTHESSPNLSREFYALNAHMLRMSGANAIQVPRLVKFPTNQPLDRTAVLKSAFGERILQTWEALSENLHDNGVIWDPQLCYTAPIWLDAIDQQNWTPICVLLVGDPMRAAQNYSVSQNVTFKRALHIWCQYLSSALQNFPAGSLITNRDAWESSSSETNSIMLPSLRRESESNLKLDELSFEISPPTALHPTSVVNRLRKFLASKTSIHGSEAFKKEADSIERLVQIADEVNENSYSSNASLPTPHGVLPEQRKVIFHCHLFKNAGTSVDHVLRENFSEAWHEAEFDGRDYVNNADLVRSYLFANPHVAALSSHTGNWFLDYDDKEELEVFPIIFVRHPVLRIRSAYKFEKTQIGVSTAGSVLAKNNDFAGYVRERMRNETDQTFKNFQSRRLGFFGRQQIVSVEHHAFEALRRLPFVGLVEDFDASLKKLESYLGPHFPSFEASSVRKNVTDGSLGSTNSKLEDVKVELGSELFDELVWNNKVDLKIFRSVCQTYGISVDHIGRTI